jgi:cellulose biosynthesis protein BcsQ
MKGIALASPKGGVGKTSLSHAIALGAAWKLIPAYFMHTDEREPLRIQNRPYMYYDARDPETLSHLMGAAVNQDGICVIDSGGNRPEFDGWISQAVDMVIIPVTPDPEAAELGMEHMERLKKLGATDVRFILNMVSSNRLEKQRDETHYFAHIPNKLILGQVPRVSAIKRLRESDTSPFETPPTNVNNLSRKVFSMVNDALNKARAPVELELEA